MDFTEIAKDITDRLNKDSDRKACMVCFILFFSMSVIFALNAAGVFILGEAMNRTMFICAVINLLSILSLVFIKNDIKRHIYIILTCVFTGVLYAGISYHVVVMLMYPVCCAALYTERRYYIEASMVSFVTILAGHVLAISWTCVFDDPLTTVSASVLFGFLPRALELLVLHCLIGYIHQRQNDTVKKLIDMSDEIYKDQEHLVYTLSKVTANFSDETGNHIKRVASYADLMFTELKYPESYRWQCTLAAMLHDFGKIRIPKEVLEKPGKLTPDEYEVVKTHARHGKDLLSNTPSPILNLASRIAYEHHECFDGSGYYGLKGYEISEVSQIVSIVDIFDALTTERSYKNAWPFDEALEYIKENSGKKFRPDLVDLFVTNIDKIRAIYEKK